MYNLRDQDFTNNIGNFASAGDSSIDSLRIDSRAVNTGTYKNLGATLFIKTNEI
jgi:hypothetical protein